MPKSPTIREVVVGEMERRGLTTYALWKLVEKHMTKPTVYNFVNEGKEMTTASLQVILDALEITLTPPK